MKSGVPKGFLSSGISAGIKKNGLKDLGLIYSTIPATVAGVFTNNRIQAAPVRLCRQRLSGGKGQAIIVNSGNANCCTGDKGIKDADAMSEATARALGISPDLVYVASTGVIGEPLPLKSIEAAIPSLVKNLSPNGFKDLSMAILTTDTIPKMILKTGSADGKPYTLIGAAKGSGMIAPDMATMLSFILTDVQADAGWLQTCLNRAVDRSFNRITIDGDTSTNDTVLLMANSLSGVVLDSIEKQTSFSRYFDELLCDLAKLIVKDAEGATKLVDIVVQGALTDKAAYRIAKTVASSSLVKTAIFGEDANWGRIMAALGRAGIAVDPERIDIYFDEVQMVQGGMGCGKETETAVMKVLQKPGFAIRITIGAGPGWASVITCDLSIDYVKINADYRS